MLSTVEHSVTLWLVDDIPARMVFGGQRWRVTDTPTRLQYTIWSTPRCTYGDLEGWRFQGTNDDGASLIFDVFEGADGWHVHKSYD